MTQLGELSRRHLGVDLSLYHAYPLPDSDITGGMIHMPMTDLAARILPRVLRQAASGVRNAGCLSLQLSSRDRLPDEAEDVLFLDATRLMAQTSCDTAAWDTVASALFTVKNQVSQQLGRPRLKVHGSKHLTMATLFGHVFRAASGFQVEIRQKTEFWSTDCPSAPTEPFAITEEYGSYHTSSLFVEIDATGKTVRDAVRRYIQRADVYPALSLRFSYFPARQGPIDNQTCCAMALQIRQTIATAVSQNEIADIHLFGTIPQGLALMIGYHLNALRPVQLYEYVQGDYYPSGRLLMERT